MNNGTQTMTEAEVRGTFSALSAVDEPQKEEAVEDTESGRVIPEQVARLADRGKERLESVPREARLSIGRRPLQAVGAALLVGLSAGLLVGRKLLS